MIVEKSEPTIVDNGNMCLRLLNEKGEHCLSILPCGNDEQDRVTCWDLATPDGKVQYCGVDNELVEVLVKHFGGFNSVR